MLEYWKSINDLNKNSANVPVHPCVLLGFGIQILDKAAYKTIADVRRSKTHSNKIYI